MKKCFLFLTALLVMTAFCAAYAEWTDYEAICENDDGVTEYYITAGHSPEAFGCIWVSGPELTLDGYETDGSLPDGLYLVCNAGSLSFSGEAGQSGEYSFSLTIRCTSAAEGEGTVRMEYVCYVVDRPIKEALTYSDGHFTLIPEEDTEPAQTLLPEYSEEDPEEAESGFFDVVDDEPYFIRSENGTHYGYEEDYWDGCSVWCAVTDCSVSAKASSYLAPQGRYSYEPRNICSGDRSNAWIEGVKGYGIGEYVDIIRRYEVCDTDYGVDFREICVVNGYARTNETWAANSRVRELGFYFNGRYVDTFTLEDTIEPQYFDLTQYGLHAASGEDSVFRFGIVSVFPGEKYADTAITGIEFDFWTPNH